MKKKILIIGAEGFLGRELLKDCSGGGEVVGTYKYHKSETLIYLDLLKYEAIEELFRSVHPDVVLLPAAISGVDYVEQNQDVAWQVNVEGTQEVVARAKRHGSFLVFYSSDYIFDGVNGPYSENAQPNPLNQYGKTKLEAERIIQRELKNFLIIRTCSIYGYEAEGLNFAMQVLRALQEKKVFRAVCDQFGTPTYVEDLSRITLTLLKNKKAGTFNVAGPNYVNRVQFAKAVAETFDLDRHLIEKVDTKQLDQQAARPARGGLTTEKLKQELGDCPRPLREGLRAMKERMKGH